MAFQLINLDNNKFKTDIESILLETEKFVNQEITDVKKIYDARKYLTEKAINLLQSNITPSTTDLFELLTRSRFDNYEDLLFRAKRNQPGSLDFEEQKNRLNEFLVNLKTVFDYLIIINFFSNKQIIIDGFEDKKDFVLNKLNLVFSDRFYAISIIFKLSNINYRVGEPEEIAQYLSERNYVSKAKSYGDTDLVKISIKGAAYIERKFKPKSKKKSPNSEKNSDLNKRIDEVLEKLTKLGYGQEIIFNEIGELKTLQTKLSKKNLGQLLKGKLIDLTLSEILNKKTAGLVYEFLTNEKLKFLE